MLFHFNHTQNGMDLTGRLFGRYRCLNGHSWISIDASKTYKICRKCDEEAEKIESRPLEYSVSQPIRCIDIDNYYHNYNNI